MEISGSLQNLGNFLVHVQAMDTRLSFPLESLGTRLSGYRPSSSGFLHPLPPTKRDAHVSHFFPIVSAHYSMA